MRKLLFLLLVVLCIGCESEERNNKLRAEREKIESDISRLRPIRDSLMTLEQSCNQKLLEITKGATYFFQVSGKAEIEVPRSGKESGYRTVHENFELTIPVQRDYYNQYNVGDKLLDHSGLFIDKKNDITVVLKVSKKYVTYGR